MKRPITFTLMLSLLLALTSSASGVKAQVRRKPVADTGAILLSTDSGSTFPMQKVRITVAPGPGVDDVTVRFEWMNYMPAAVCSGGVCRHTVASQGASAPITLGAGDAVSLDVPPSPAVRVMVFANRDVQVQGEILDSQGNVVTTLFAGSSTDTIGNPSG